jgi:hypothetical protein
VPSFYGFHESDHPGLEQISHYCGIFGIEYGFSVRQREARTDARITCFHIALTVRRLLAA